jgi:hypothetical protein
VSLLILFWAMSKFGNLGIPKEYIKMTKILFQDANVLVCLNGSKPPSFPIGHGVRQGCPLASFLFIFEEEVLHVASVKTI